MKKRKFCCQFMATFLKDSRVGVYYDSVLRFYSIFVPSSGSYQKVSFCPWCGYTFPADLIEKYEEILKDMSKKNNEQCCKSMQAFLDEGSVGIYYDSIIRGYFICLRGVKNGQQVIYYCPWCGSKFSESLVEVYLETLEKDFNILMCSYTGTYFKPGQEDTEIDLPEEFKSAEWWKKRNL